MKDSRSEEIAELLELGMQNIEQLSLELADSDSLDVIDDYDLGCYNAAMLMSFAGHDMELGIMAVNSFLTGVSLLENDEDADLGGIRLIAEAYKHALDLTNHHENIPAEVLREMLVDARDMTIELAFEAHDEDRTETTAGDLREFTLDMARKVSRDDVFAQYAVTNAFWNAAMEVVGEHSESDPEESGFGTAVRIYDHAIAALDAADEDLITE